MTVNYIGKKTVIRDSFKEYAEKRLKSWANSLMTILW